MVAVEEDVAPVEQRARLVLVGAAHAPTAGDLCEHAGAMVRITNTETSQTQQLVTNASGYFEASLLNPGTYGSHRATRRRKRKPYRSSHALLLGHIAEFHLDAVG